ncbi:hypothetical protein NCLIV_038340 [Neospora caninum Liverpool]|uniref:PA14 domain-containing protein n=1 Tax=Neospora caninum (strain Liverpool) TaxID=572307 RepID=F0VCD5_NEOCL|nr:hypothetical protein NCLIV_038340 [Neospora caninum Liverpool]CBZ50759.1 hypothetical protein NCLIV_038340 [Neospora caninum Liverpool]CEL68058.1 TPA: PA14 domain-containing protein [Neospora caninum Liverpool]|eukprot:XP_003880792.1 hypothetical protein NCLIV_038340 [Neospora caninum Liverpool]
MWESSSPAKGIPYQDFSVRWDGYVMAPTTGRFEFVTHADCGVRVFLDGSPIIVDRMPTPSEGSAFSDSPIRILEPTEDTGLRKTYSARQVKCCINRQTNLVNTTYPTDTQAKVSLGWRSSSTPEQIIQDKYLFKGTSSPALRISGLPGETFDVNTTACFRSLLENGVLAFTDSTEYVVADVPSKYEGSQLIRARTNPNTSKLRLEISADAYIYVALPHGGVRPVQNSAQHLQPLRFEDSGDSLSVYLVERDAVNTWSSGSCQSLASTTDCRRKRVNKSLLTYTGGEFSPALLGFLFQLSQVVSLTGSDLFSSCTSSSYASGRLSKSGARKSMVRESVPSCLQLTSSGNGIGQFIIVYFTKPVGLAAFQFKPLDDPASWPTEISLEFPGRFMNLRDNFAESDPAISGSRDIQRIAVQPGDHTYQLSPHVTTAVKATITGWCATGMMSGITYSATTAQLCGIPSSLSQLGDLLLLLALPVSRLVKQSISIAFGGGAAGFVPTGYSLDDGSPKTAHGSFFYGWDHETVPVNPKLCRHESSMAGGVTFPEPKCSEMDKCNSLVDCNYPNSWSIDMPSYGSYRVTVEVGSPCGDAHANDLFINGVPFIVNEILHAGQYSTVSVSCRKTKQRYNIVGDSFRQLVRSLSPLLPLSPSRLTLGLRCNLLKSRRWKTHHCRLLFESGASIVMVSALRHGNLGDAYNAQASACNKTSPPRPKHLRHFCVRMPGYFQKSTAV